MKNITFYKMSGSGNDFIIIDNRNSIVSDIDLSVFAKKVCKRKMSVGADGLILLENASNVDFKWQFFNSDGSRAEMCGNGARCAARFAYINKIASNSMSFQTDAGIVSAYVSGDKVKIKMTDPFDLKIDFNVKIDNDMFNDILVTSSINTGVPHAVIEVTDIEATDVFNLGRLIRYHEMFQPAGTNVNFIQFKEDNTIVIRTYERGVEDETLACGTGSVAVALISASKYQNKSPINVLTRSGGYLTIHFKEKDGVFSDIYLEGDARIIYKAELFEEGCNY
ncbi:MAG: diaminopimelate epimerase [Desulfobacterales bacterium]|nr:diaminopimelate epimerase [Desulfobacterales bacterium]MBF0398879.1 diaminopimelate epimerase [Desulfobacterales bacterium]